MSGPLTNGQILTLQKYAMDLVSHCKWAILGRDAVTESMLAEGRAAMSACSAAWDALERVIAPRPPVTARENKE